MNNLRKKLKKTNKPLRSLFYIIFLIYLVSFIFIVKSLLLLSGIESFIRFIIIIILLIILLIYLLSGLVLLILKKHRLLILTSLLMSAFIVINCAGYYYINKTYNYISHISKDKILYTTNLVTLANNKSIKKVGMISEENDVEGYILPKEYLEKNNNNYEIKYYDNYLSLLNALYDEELDGIFITNNYVLIYDSIERFTKIKTDTRVFTVFSKELKNQDLLISTNKSVTEPFTVLIIGVDSKYDGLAQNAAFNGDTLMLVSFNPKNLSATIFSIPRDTFVPISCNNDRSNKINSAAAYGTKCMVDTIENFTNITIDYYVKTNFKGVVSLVDALGGITVDVPVPDYPKQYCVQDSNRVAKKICLTPGVSKLNGEEALALSRVRYAFARADFKRVQNQQLIIEAIVKKAKKIRNVNDFYNVLNAVSRNLDTNLSTKEMLNFYNVGKSILAKGNLKDNDFIDIEKTELTGYGLTINIGKDNTYTFQYYESSLNEITNAMKVTLGLEKPDIIKTFQFSVNDIYEPRTVGHTTNIDAKKEILPNFVNKTLNYLDNWNKNININIQKNYKEDNNCINNTILSQNINPKTLLTEIKTLNVSICKNIDNNNSNDNDIINKENENTDTEIESVIEDLLN
ncbi:MAG: LCP family protein [Bacilli bacterium]|nr:LCP family protein [Bacilli bacterium]